MDSRILPSLAKVSPHENKFRMSCKRTRANAVRHAAMNKTSISTSQYNFAAVTLSYINGVSETPLLGETIGQCLDRISARFADADALVSRHQGVRYTYRELHRQVEIVARGLMSLGVKRGDRVGVWSPNCAEWFVAQYALAKAGAIMVHVNPAYRLRELEHALAQSGVSVLLSARGF